MPIPGALTTFPDFNVSQIPEVVVGGVRFIGLEKKASLLRLSDRPVDLGLVKGAALKNNLRGFFWAQKADELTGKAEGQLFPPSGAG